MIRLNRSSSTGWLVLVAAALLSVLSACGDDDSSGGDVAADTADVPESREAGETTAPGDDGDTVEEPTGQVATGEGSVTLDGETTDVTSVHRCIPFRDEPGNLDLTAFIMDVGGYLIVYVEGGGASLKDISLNNVDEATFGSSVFSTDLDNGAAGTFSVEGNHITGSGTVYDAFDSGASVEVAFDFTFPDQAEDCSL